MSEPSGRGRLKRHITLPHLVGIEIGQSIGAGIFALTGLALARTGPSLPLAFLAAAVPVGLSMAVLAMLALRQPISRVPITTARASSPRWPPSPGSGPICWGRCWACSPCTR
jgi:L-asparagine transporter-like permease